MATMKAVKIDAKLGEGFKVESKVGNHVLYVDQPKSGGGTDAGPSPLEYFLVALAGCIATISRIVAHQKKITLRGVELSIEGSLDLDAVLGKSSDNRPGFGGIEIKAKIDADMSSEEKEAFLHEVDKRCPVSDNILYPTPVSLVLQE